MKDTILDRWQITAGDLTEVIDVNPEQTPAVLRHARKVIPYLQFVGFLLAGGELQCRPQVKMATRQPGK